MCKYSIIIPVYDVRAFVETCLQSVFRQIPPDVQVILVDDGSTDGSGEICDAYARRYPQAEVLHLSHRGVGAARNAGLRAARGEYLLWVDPDDWVSEAWFQAIDEAISKRHPDLLVFDFIEWEDGQKRQSAYGRPGGAIDRELFLSDVTRDIRMNSSLWNKVIRKALYNGLQFDETLRCLEDYALLHHLILRADSVLYCPLFLYHYRIRSDSLVRTRNLDVSYQSYLVALQRKAEIEATGRTCDSMGCVFQARGFCRNYYLMQMPRAHLRRFQTCQANILRDAKHILTERELDWAQRIKLLLIPIPLFGKVYFRKKLKKMQGEFKCEHGHDVSL